MQPNNTTANVYGADLYLILFDISRPAANEIKFDTYTVHY